MKRRLILFFILISSVAGAAEITPATLNTEGVRGRLGHRLGTIVVISGTVVKNETRAKEMSDHEIMLSITSVNEQALPAPVLYPFSPSPLAKIEVPKAGHKFQCHAYETGEFLGSPEGEYGHVPIYQSKGYSFETRLVVLK